MADPQDTPLGAPTVSLLPLQSHCSRRASKPQRYPLAGSDSKGVPLTDPISIISERPATQVPRPTESGTWCGLSNVCFINPSEKSNTLEAREHHVQGK